MTKPIEKPEWASDNTALKVDPSATNKSFGWQTSNGEITGEPPKPDLQTQNGWQYRVYQWVDWMEKNAPVYVAANNSSTYDKDRAEFVCDGTADDLTIKSALDACITRSKKVVLLDGLYLCDDPITLGNAYDGVELCGANEARLAANAEVAQFISLSDASYMKVHNFIFDGSQTDKFRIGFNMGTGSFHDIRNIIFETDSLKTSDANTCSAFQIAGSVTNCSIRAKFETLSLVGTSTGKVCLMAFIGSSSNDAIDNDCYFEVAKRALIGTGTNVYYDNVYHINRTQIPYTNYNNINTSWINCLGDYPLVGDPPDSYEQIKEAFRYVNGNIELMWLESFPTITGATGLYYHPYPPNMATECHEQNADDPNAGNTLCIGEPFKQENGTVQPELPSAGDIFTVGSTTGIVVSNAASELLWTQINGGGGLDLYGPRQGGILTINLMKGDGLGT